MKRKQIQIDTGISYSGGEWMYISTNERRLIKRLQKLAESQPEQCVIEKLPEDNGGFIFGKFNPKCLRITSARQSHYTDDQRAKMAQNLRRNIGVEEKGAAQ